jgi:hypothetical protein
MATPQQSSGHPCIRCLCPPPFQALGALPVDLVTLPLLERLPFKLQAQQLKEAVARGLQFEVGRGGWGLGGAGWGGWGRVGGRGAGQGCGVYHPPTMQACLGHLQTWGSSLTTAAAVPFASCTWQRRVAHGGFGWMP